MQEVDSIIADVLGFPFIFLLREAGLLGLNRTLFWSAFILTPQIVVGLRLFFLRRLTRFDVLLDLLDLFFQLYFRLTVDFLSVVLSIHGKLDCIKPPLNQLYRNYGFVSLNFLVFLGFPLQIFLKRSLEKLQNYRA